MRSDAGINGDAQCIEQMTWMFFLKGYDTQEETWEYKAYKEKKEYNSIIPESLRRRQKGAEYRARVSSPKYGCSKKVLPDSNKCKPQEPGHRPRRNTATSSASPVPGRQ